VGGVGGGVGVAVGCSGEGCVALGGTGVAVGATGAGAAVAGCSLWPGAMGCEPTNGGCVGFIASAGVGVLVGVGVGAGPDDPQPANKIAARANISRMARRKERFCNMRFRIQ